jgi:Leucine-rich repeat (LRR) protein
MGVMVALAGLGWFSGCGDGAVEPAPAEPARPASVAVEPSAATLTWLGQTVVFRAAIKDQYDAAFPGTVTWSSSDRAVFTIDAGGTATAVANGSGTLTATFQGLSAAAALQVAQAPASLEAASGDGQEARLGAVLAEPVVVRAADAGGSPVEGATVVFTPGEGHGTADPAEAVTDSAGLARTTWTLGEAMGDQRLEAAVRDVSVDIVTRTINPDRAALIALYEATDGPNWVDNTNWLTDAPLGEWYGVETDASGRVVTLRLSGVWDNDARAWVPFGLQGTIPPELGNLAHLRLLGLGASGLTGTIPPELGKLANLESLGLSRNGLTGVIPPELGRLSNLESLWLRANALSGSIPPELGMLTELVNLELTDNQLTGPIPPELRGLASLTNLRLGFNSLTGPVPPWLGDLTELSVLSLRSNDFSGPIPPELGNLTELSWLLLSLNNLTGPIPQELLRLKKLDWLSLSHNNLTGPIPPQLGSLTNLTQLSLASNQLTGGVPRELGNLTELTALSLFGNQLTGGVPRELGNLTELTILWLSDNRLTGSFPPSILGLEKLVSLGCRRTEGICLPATDEFREWARQVDARGNVGSADVPFCDEIDKEALEAFYDATNGSGWTRSDGWLDDENLDRWHGVRTDSIGRVSGLDLNNNGLSGQVPGALGRLASLTELRIRDNAIEGRLPLALAGVSLEEFDYAGTSLCVPDDAGFLGWLNGIPRHSGTGAPCPPLTEREVLEELYRSAGGPDWVSSGGWLTDAPLAQWQGVETDATGSVVALRLRRNHLTGSLPVELARLPELRVLDLAGNGLAGQIPPGLGALDRLERLNLGRNRLSGGIPSSFGQLSELRQLALVDNGLSGTVPAELGDLGRLELLELGRNQFVGEIPAELGELANLTQLDLGENLLTGTIPPELGDLERLQSIDLHGNQLSGSVPSSLGRLSAMEAIRLADNQLSGSIPTALGALGRLLALDLSGNELTGPIPSELGDLGNLRELRLFANDLSGSIPSELGSLSGLGVLELAGNQLAGSIPERLGDLANLTRLDLGNNQLSGPLPSELGRASRLASVDVRSNVLTGPLPPEFGHLTLLNQLILADNPDLAGPLPPGMTELGGLERFMAGGTGLCRPAEPGFDTWFRAIPDRRLVRCEGGAAVYLTQTIQSWDDPVPMLAGESALLRVFVTAPQESAATMPVVRATFYVDGAERHTVLIPASAETIPSEIVEGDLVQSANAEIPDWVITPGLEMAIEIDPEGVLDPALGVTKRIPDSGRMTVDVREVPPFRLTLIPFLLESNPDSSAVEDVSAMAADPDGHELLSDIRTLLPVTALTVAAREPVIVSNPDMYAILRQVSAIRIMEGGSGYWMGVSDGRRNPGNSVTVRGVADPGGQVSASIRQARTMAHELGHNLSLRHAPCGSPNQTDPWFPHVAGRTGVWGYDFGQQTLVTPEAADIMSYCEYGVQWISDFFFNKALDHRLGSADTDTRAAAQPTRSLLLWGGRDGDGVPYLDPAFVVDAAPALPPAGTEYTIEGADADGTLLFSYTFDMPATADAEGQDAGFVWALPVQPAWTNALASVTLSGPGGLVTLDESTDRPMAILRDPQTGQVRGFLSDVPGPAQAAADAAGSALAPNSRVQVLFSRGIPDETAWRK